MIVLRRDEVLNLFDRKRASLWRIPLKMLLLVKHIVSRQWT